MLQKIRQLKAVRGLFRMYEVKLKPARIEVMHYMAQKIDSIIDEFLKKIDTNWQPADLLPDSTQ